jgi:aminotransferase
MSSSRIAEHVRNIPRSGIRDFFEIVQSMKGVISLGIGEPDFVTPWHIREAAIYSLEKGKTGYTSNLGTPRLRRAIAKYVEQHFAVEYKPHDEIIVTVGVSEAIDLALRSMLNPGDEVLYHEPCYVSYRPSIQLAGGVPVAVATRAEDEFSLKASDLEKAVTSKTRVLMLNFPTNPTGAVMPLEELKKIAEFSIKHNLVVLTDEIYSELTYDELSHHSIAALPGMKERTLFMHGFSKAFAMTGWRIGYACGPADIIEAMMKIHQYSMLCASTMSQEAACEALERGQRSMERMKEEYRLRRNYIVSSLNEAGIPCHLPKGAFYVFPDIRGTGLISKDFSLKLLDAKKVAVVPGTAFGPSGEGYVRCSYAAGMDQIKLACQLISEFVRDIPGTAS